MATSHRAVSARGRGVVVLAGLLLALGLLAAVLPPPASAVPPRRADGTYAAPGPSAFVPVTLDPAETEPPAAPASLGVASFNLNRYRPVEQIARDIRRLTSRADVDVIGWQEADLGEAAFRRLRASGWETMFFRHGAHEEPISWRADRLELVSAAQVRMHGGDSHVRYRFPARYVTRVTLRDLATGRTLSVLNTHLNQRTMQWQRPGRWRHSRNAEMARRHFAQLARMWLAVPGRYVVGTGDFNVDYRSEARSRPVGGPSRRFEGRAVANWSALGTRGIDRTVHVYDAPRAHWIFDTVYVSQRSLSSGWLRFTQQAVLRGYGSDHLPVVVRLALR